MISVIFVCIRSQRPYLYVFFPPSYLCSQERMRRRPIRWKEKKEMVVAKSSPRTKVPRSPFHLRDFLLQLQCVSSSHDSLSSSATTMDGKVWTQLSFYPRRPLLPYNARCSTLIPHHSCMHPICSLFSAFCSLLTPQLLLAVRSHLVYTNYSSFTVYSQQLFIIHTNYSQFIIRSYQLFIVYRLFIPTIYRYSLVHTIYRSQFVHAYYLSFVLLFIVRPIVQPIIHHLFVRSSFIRPTIHCLSDRLSNYSLFIRSPNYSLLIRHDVQVT